MADFDDARLDDPEALRVGDLHLRPLAEAGARMRRDGQAAAPALAALAADERPRAIITVGPESRLIRAVVEPTCPVPVVAWPNMGLPAWVGPLDIVVVLGGEGLAPRDAVVQALRRGCRVILTAAEGSDLAQLGASRLTTLLPSLTTDPHCRAVSAVAALARLGLAHPVDADEVADSLDAAAIECAPGVDIAHNPAKTLALELADTYPLVWGGSVLAARASRRLAEALRDASGRMALAADADALLPLITESEPPDPFHDPFEDARADQPLSLVIVDDGRGTQTDDEARDDLVRYAASAHLRISHLDARDGTDLVRYASVLQRGRYAAAYLAVGLGRSPHA